MTDPNWTPKEPRRPLQPKPGAFGPEHRKVFDDIDTQPKREKKEGDGNPVQP